MDIESVRRAVEAGPLKTDGLSKPQKAEGFGDLLKKVATSTNEFQLKADQTVVDFVDGKEQDIHNVMLGINKAELSFRFMMEVRNKMIEAYQEINRMSV